MGFVEWNPTWIMRADCIYFSKAIYTFCLLTGRLTCMPFYIKMCFDSFGSLTRTHYLRTHFDCFSFYHKVIMSTIHVIYIFNILQILAVNLGPCKKYFQLGPAATKAGFGLFCSTKSSCCSYLSTPFCSLPL